MYTIAKLTSHPTVDFAAEELKKYLRMMMPRAGEIPIAYNPEATEGFRLLVDGTDALDDIITLHTDAQGGLIAGSNPGALLLAVYRYLKCCGCRWLFPGVDGEWIPVLDELPPVDLYRKASLRYRGQCNEGAEYQQCMMETIDFTPKIGMNTYMLEFDVPRTYYNKYYNRTHNPVLTPEPVTAETVLQWKRQCEVEISKRGLRYHDMGHGWTAEPFGLDSSLGWEVDDSAIPESAKPYIALFNGKRGLDHGIALNTNFCMSNPEARQIVARYVADYARKQNNVDFLHIWLSDGVRNNCECDLCRTLPVSDWYVMLLNDIDAELTRLALSTHLVFIAYHDTLWPPIREKLLHPDRFTLLFAPISRLYTESYGMDADDAATSPYTLNQNQYPRGMAGNLAYLRQWQKEWSGDCFCYEYHFWIHQYYDPTGLTIAKVIYDDIKGLQKHNLKGIVEDGSQRSFFPHGFAFYLYGEMLFDESQSYEDLERDYFSHAYGEGWEEALAYLKQLSQCFAFEDFTGRFTDRTGGADQFGQHLAERAAPVHALTEAMGETIAKYRQQPKRPAAVMWSLLDIHRRQANALAEIITLRAQGEHAQALERQKQLMREFGALEPAIERYYDHYMFCAAHLCSHLFQS